MEKFERLSNEIKTHNRAFEMVGFNYLTLSGKHSYEAWDTLYECLRYSSNLDELQGQVLDMIHNGSLHTDVKRLLMTWYSKHFE